MRLVEPQPAMLALGWLLSSNTPMQEKIAEAIKALRIYKFDEGQPLGTRKQTPPEPEIPGYHWTYKGVECWIEEDREEDCTKNWHWVRLPGSVEKLVAPISPYDGADAVNMWIDMGCPMMHPGGGNWMIRAGNLR